MALEPDVDKLITDWFRRVRESQRIHYECGDRYSRFNRWFGIPTIVLSTVVGTAVFTTLDTQFADKHISVKLILGLLSVTAAVLASLQTFMSFGERADRHRITGSRYGSIRRSLELLKTFPPATEDAVVREVQAIKKEMDDLAEKAPHVPSRMKKRIDKEMNEKDQDRIFSVPRLRSGERS